MDIHIILNRIGPKTQGSNCRKNPGRQGDAEGSIVRGLVEVRRKEFTRQRHKVKNFVRNGAAQCEGSRRLKRKRKKKIPGGAWGWNGLSTTGEGGEQ